MNKMKRLIYLGLLGALALGTALLTLTTRVSARSEAAPSAAQASLIEVPGELLVGETEALAVADLWFAMEFNRIHPRQEALEAEVHLDQKAGALFDQLNQRRVFYLVSGNNLLDRPPKDERVLAYIVQYIPLGYVVVAGSDRIEPIIAFSAESEFRWDQPEVNFMHYFLGKDLPNRWDYLENRLAAGVEVRVEAQWEDLRAQLRSTQSLGEASFVMAPDDILVEIDTAVWGQSPFYNDLVSTNNGNNDEIPTGCTATAMAIKMRYHQWPAVGSSLHSYTDNSGSVQFSHSVNFSNQTYNYGNMPTTSLTAANTDIATLMYHAGVAVDMDYEVGWAGAWPTPYSMNVYFRYKGTTEVLSSHETPIVKSIRGGLPVVISSSAHTVLVDGYRDTGTQHFHLNVGWDGVSDGWYNLDEIPASDQTIDRSYPYSAPNNYFYVDPAWSGSENGNIQTPYNTFNEGYTQAVNGHLWLNEGTYSGSYMLDDAMTIHSYEGAAYLGP